MLSSRRSSAPTVRSLRRRGLSFKLQITIARRHRQHCCDQRYILWRQAGRCDDFLQLAQTLLSRITARETGFLLPACHDRMQRALLMQRRAEIPQAGMRLTGQSFFQCRQQARLADPRLAGNQHQPALTVLCLLPGPQQRAQLLITSDQPRQCRGLQSLGPAAERAGAEHLPRWYRTGDAPDSERAERRGKQIDRRRSASCFRR